MSINILYRIFKVIRMTSGELIKVTRNKKHLSRDAILNILNAYGYEMSIARLRRIEGDLTKKTFQDMIILTMTLDISFEDLTHCDDLNFTQKEG